MTSHYNKNKKIFAFSQVERSHSAHSERNQIGRNFERNNNEILIANQHFSLFDIQKERYDALKISKVIFVGVLKSMKIF